MSGLCGWLGGAGASADNGDALRAMASRLLPGDSVPIDTKLLPGAALAGAAGPSRCLLDASGEAALAIVGHWRSENAELARALSGPGAAAAFAARLEASPERTLSMLAGNFALAFVRGGDSPELLLAIDRMGIGSLCWQRLDDGGVRFATALPALAAHPGAALETDPQALFDYIYFHMIPAPATVYKGVQRLTPGSFLRLRGGRVETGEHARTRFSNERGKARFDVAKQEFRGLLEESVRDAVGGDTGVGSFLSGGTDSSTVSGYLGSVTGRPARCFSIGFDQAGFDEIEYARTAARQFAAEHHERYVTPQDIVALVPRLAAAYGEPFGNSSVIPTFYCASMAREHGLTAMLAGDGGDELFGGNARYARQKIFGLYDQLPGALRRGVLEPLADRLRGADAIMPLRKFRRYVEQAKMPMPERMESYNLVTWFGAETIFEGDFLAQIDLQRPARMQREVYDAGLAETMMNRMLAMDWKFTLADNDLRKVTTMCQLAGVDVRYPLMDERLVDFSARLPIDWKVKGQRLRWFFKKALEDYLPAEIITKSKHGFGLPFGSWVVSDPQLGQLAFDLLGDFSRRGIVRRDFVDQLRNKWIHDTPNFYGSLVWLFMILESWLQEGSRSARAAA